MATEPYPQTFRRHDGVRFHKIREPDLFESVDIAGVWQLATAESRMPRRVIGADGKPVLGSVERSVATHPPARG